MKYKNHSLRKKVVCPKTFDDAQFRDFKIAYNHYIDLPPTCKIKSTSDFQHYIWPFAHDIEDPIYKVKENPDGTCSCSL